MECNDQCETQRVVVVRIGFMARAEIKHACARDTQHGSQLITQRQRDIGFIPVLFSLMGTLKNSEFDERNLLRKRPTWSAGLDYWRERVGQSRAIGPCPDAGLPPKDAPVLAAAIASKAD